MLPKRIFSKKNIENMLTQNKVLLPVGAISEPIITRSKPTLCEKSRLWNVYLFLTINMFSKSLDDSSVLS